MSSAEPPIPPPNEPEKQPDQPEAQSTSPEANADAAMDTTPDPPAEETWDDIPVEVMALSTDEILTRIRLIENDIKARLHVAISLLTSLIIPQVMRSETHRLQHEQSVMKEKIRDNGEKIKQNKVLPYLVGNVVEVSVMHTVLVHDLILPRFLTSTPKAKRTEAIETWTQCGRENVPSSKRPPAKQSFSPSSALSLLNNSNPETLWGLIRIHISYWINFPQSLIPESRLWK
jgi:hypothetical protein